MPPSNQNADRQGRNQRSVSTNPGLAAAIPPASRTLYHGVHPGSPNGDETSIEDLGAYERAVGKDVAFVYFTQELDRHWLDNDDEVNHPLFPHRQVDTIHDHHAIPIIRLMIRTTTETNSSRNKEQTYSYDVILGEGTLSPAQQADARKLHDWLVAWGREATRETRPLYVEWGTEVNGEWFWWNAKWYGEARCAGLKGGARNDCLAREYLAGTVKFRRSFQHLRDLINGEAHAANVKWIFHVTAGSEPDPGRSRSNQWNSLSN